MKLPPPRPRTLRVNRDNWESVTNFLTKLTENPNRESISFFQGYAEVILQEIAETQPPASATPPRSSAGLQKTTAAATEPPRHEPTTIRP